MRYSHHTPFYIEVLRKVFPTRITPPYGSKTGTSVPRGISVTHTQPRVFKSLGIRAASTQSSSRIIMTASVAEAAPVRMPLYIPSNNASQICLTMSLLEHSHVYILVGSDAQVLIHVAEIWCVVHRYSAFEPRLIMMGFMYKSLLPVIIRKARSWYCRCSIVCKSVNGVKQQIPVRLNLLLKLGYLHAAY